MGGTCRENTYHPNLPTCQAPAHQAGRHAPCPAPGAPMPEDRLWRCSLPRHLGWEAWEHAQAAVGRNSLGCFWEVVEVGGWWWAGGPMACGWAGHCWACRLVCTQAHDPSLPPPPTPCYAMPMPAGSVDLRGRNACYPPCHAYVLLIACLGRPDRWCLVCACKCKCPGACCAHACHLEPHAMPYCLGDSQVKLCHHDWEAGRTGQEFRWRWDRNPNLAQLVYHYAPFPMETNGRRPHAIVPFLGLPLPTTHCYFGGVNFWALGFGFEEFTHLYMI